MEIFWHSDWTFAENLCGWTFAVVGVIAIIWWNNRQADREKRRNIERDCGMTYEEFLDKYPELRK